MKSSLGNFQNLNILVIGDIILDIFLYGESNRISPEAPIPVVEIKKELMALGGAGNVAANLASLGINTHLVGLIGDDVEGNHIKSLLKQHKINANLLLTDKRNTTVKTRVIAASQQLIRFDKESKNKIDKYSTLEIIKKIDTLIDIIDAIIISDYGKGMISKFLIEEITSRVKKHNIILTVDPKIEHFYMYKNVFCLTPNQKEASEATKIKIESEKDLIKCGNIIMKKLNCSCLIITRGPFGMTLFNGNDSPVHIKSAAKEVYDVTGAGDTVISIFTAAKACGYDTIKAAQLANLAAGIVVSKIGTATVAVEELQNVVEGA
jgi:D-beta-D-heptose 7-phosphate kinase/D-beta-D-heptose 1-phosphate adenosyltransferase